MQCIKHTKVAQNRKSRPFQRPRWLPASTTEDKTYCQWHQCLPHISSKMNTLFFDFFYDRTTELNWLLWWIWHTIWLRMIDTPWWCKLRHEWSGWRSRGSDIQCRQPLIQTDVKLCLIDRFSFVAKALVKPGDYNGHASPVSPWFYQLMRVVWVWQVF